MAEFGPGSGLRLCHHTDVIGQYPDMHDGTTVRRTHAGKSSIKLMEVL